jgi:hypothetical protein
MGTTSGVRSVFLSLGWTHSNRKVNESKPLSRVNARNRDVSPNEAGSSLQGVVLGESHILAVDF